jgi:hypothetical protein
VSEPTDPIEDFTAPRRRFDLPAVIALAVVALAAGLILSRNATRSAAERAEAPPRPDCVRFPGACDETVPDEPPPGLATRAAEVAFAEARWREAFAAGRRTGVIPDKALTALREALGTTESAVRDARALVHASTTKADSFATGGALEIAYDNRLALLTRATRLLEDAPSPVSGYGQPRIDEGTAVPAGAVVSVRLQSGSVRVIGWTHDSVHVTGRLAPGETWVTERTATSAGDTVRVRAEGLPRGLSAPSELEIHMPRRSRLVLRAAAASLVVRDLDAELDLATAAGNLLVESVQGPVRAETMQGTLTVVGPLPRLEASTSSGALLASVPYDTTMVGEEPVATRRPGITVPFGEVILRSVSGRITFDAPAVGRALVSNVRGDVRFAAAPLPGNTLTVTSHAGLTTVAWPDAVGALLDVSSYKGGVRVPARGDSLRGRVVVRSVRGDLAFEALPQPE